MKITVINQNDSLGGAAVVSHRLCDALRHEGCDARLLVMHAPVHGNEPWVEEYGAGIKGKLYFLAERAEIFLRNGMSRANLFKVSTASFGYNLAKHPLVLDADAIILNWINQGAMSMKGIEALALLRKPLIWTMHDMWCCTGICHHAYDCKAYEASCGKCRFLSSNDSNDLSRSVLMEKRRILSGGRFNFVAVSSWLAQRCRDSSLLGNAAISVIPNAFPLDNYRYELDNEARKCYGIPLNAKVIVMAAARLDDPVKGIDRGIDALNALTRTGVHVVFAGNIRNAALLDRLKMPHTLTGLLAENEVTALLRSADVVISPSHFETSGATLVEGLASGCVPVAFDSGGQRDIINHMTNGYLAQCDDVSDFAHGIAWALDAGIRREDLHESAVSNFDSKQVAQKYIELINKIKK